MPAKQTPEKEYDDIPGTFVFDADRSRLYDVCADPGETLDLSTRAPERTQTYRARLRLFLSSKLND